MKPASRLAIVFLGTLCLLAIAGPAAAQNASNQSGQPNVETQQYQDWQVRCVQTASGEQCRMTQLINNPDSDSPIMRVIVDYPPQLDSAAMAFLLPLGSRLRPGLRIDVAGRQPFRIPFRVCLPKGCRATLLVKDSLLAKFKQGTSFTVTLHGPRGRKINLDVSLMGFTAANNAIEP